MIEKTKVHNLIILDESGSMNSIKDMIISGFNEVVQTVKDVSREFPEQDHFITLISFGGRKVNTHLDVKHVLELDEIDGDKYRPRGGTPLFDALGQGINHLRSVTDKDANCNVLVTILTDGMENASTEYDRAAIKALIEEMENKNWTFSYIGTDHGVEEFAISISIKNSMRFVKNQEGLKDMFERERKSRRYYSQKIRRNEDTKENFYSNEE